MLLVLFLTGGIMVPMELLLPILARCGSRSFCAPVELLRFPWTLPPGIPRTPLGLSREGLLFLRLLAPWPHIRLLWCRVLEVCSHPR